MLGAPAASSLDVWGVRKAQHPIIPPSLDLDSRGKQYGVVELQNTSVGWWDPTTQPF